jgi:hypothetical protein
MANEINGEGRPLNKPGVYRHKETGVEVELDVNPGIGTPLIDAYKQVGYEYVRPLGTPDEEVVTKTKEK